MSQAEDSRAYVLTINAGSSSLKFSLYRQGYALELVLSGKFDRIRLPEGRLYLHRANGEGERPIDLPDHDACMPTLLQVVETELGGGSLRAVGHRVVHGGPRFTAPAPVTAEMLAALAEYKLFAPQHVPMQIAIMEAFRRRLPDVPQVAVFDTAFHADLPMVAKLLPIPRRYFEKGVRRYGFHGISYTYLMQELARIAAQEVAGRVILAHLGNGASMAAVMGGRSVDTTMAFTPAAGLTMSTRPGDLDPGLAMYLATVDGLSPEAFHEMVNKQSGLLGLSETSSDVRDLLSREATDPRAAEALAVFCHQCRKWVGAMAAAMGGLDTLVFTGGIGENAAEIRARICEKLAFLDLAVDPARNSAHASIISSDGSRVTVRVMPTDEEMLIARETCACLRR